MAWRVQRPTCSAHSWNIIANQCNLEVLKAASARYNIRAAVAGRIKVQCDECNFERGVLVL